MTNAACPQCQGHGRIMLHDGSPATLHTGSMRCPVCSGQGTELVLWTLLNQARAEAARYRAALEELADRANWVKGSEWIGPDDYAIYFAAAALAEDLPE